MKLLVTGGAGFIGSTVLKLAIAHGHVVVNFDALTYASSLESLKSISEHPRYHFECADVRDRNVVGRILEEYSPDAVIHLAAESHVDRSIDEPAAFVQTNVVGTYNMLDAFRAHWLAKGQPAHFRFLHVSTDEVFGSLGTEGRFNEETAYAPRSPYSATKAASDHLVSAWFETYGLPALITNCSNNYGPFQFPEKLIPMTILKALAGQPIPVYGTGENVRDWLHVSDHAEALLKVLQTGQVGRSYNIGAEREVRNIDLVNAICDRLDVLLPEKAPHRQLIEFVCDRPGHDARYAIDPSRIQRELNWRASIPFSEGLTSVIDWYLENQGWCKSLQDRDGFGVRLGRANT